MDPFDVGKAMTDRGKRQPDVNGPSARKQDPRGKGKDRFAPGGNDRIADQTRKLLGKHYANKYPVAR